VTLVLYISAMGKEDALGLAIWSLETEDLEALPPEDVGQDLIWFEELSRRFEAERSRRIGVFDSHEGHDVLGYPSAVAFLKDRCRMTGGRAKHLVSVARAARRFKATFLSWKHGQISTDQAQHLFRASEQMPDKYPDAENVLLEIVGDTPEETRQVLAYWRHSVDKPGVVIENELQLQRRRLDYTRKANGMIEGDFALTETAGEAFVTALDALMPPPDANDERTASQRRHDGFEDLARSYLEGSESPEVGGEKPHLNIHVDLNALKGVAGGLHETEDGEVLGVETIRQLACDASVSRIVFGPESEILDVGRKTRVIPAGLRRAVIARDRHCTYKGCGRSARWCDVHHIIFWADGGETVLDNLCLLCRYHHTLIHKQQAEDLDHREPSVPAGRRRPI
ncbi:MAG: DUF222 domain-containing protein, partial [Acidimicrobiia bacterium]